MSETLTPTWILMSDPDITQNELEAVKAVLCTSQLSGGPVVEEFEKAFAAYAGRKHAIAVSSGTQGLLLVLEAYGLTQGEEVVCPPFSWRETMHAVALAGAKPVFADIDYWSGTLSADKAAAAVTGNTRAIVASNTNGHPAPWGPLRDLAKDRGLILIEDSTEAIGSIYQGAPVGSFGDCAVFDFAQPSALTTGEGGMVVTDDDGIANILRQRRGRKPEERASVVIGAVLPHQAGMSDLAAALGLAQLRRIDAILEKRKGIEAVYLEFIQSFEGLKPPYVAPEVEEVHWFLYLVHLGTRFSRSSRDAIVEDMRTESIEAAGYAVPLHLQPYYFDRGYRRGDFFVTEKVADRALALPFHTHLTPEQIAFIVGTAKDASINIGAGAAIY